MVTASHPSVKVLIPALPTLGNIMRGDYALTKVLTIIYTVEVSSCCLFWLSSFVMCKATSLNFYFFEMILCAEQPKWFFWYSILVLKLFTKEQVYFQCNLGEEIQTSIFRFLAVTV